MYHKDTFMMRSFSNPYIFESSSPETQRCIINDLISTPQNIPKINQITMNRISHSAIFEDSLKNTLNKNITYLCNLSSNDFLTIFLGVGDKMKEYIMKYMLTYDYLFTISLLLPCRYGYNPYTETYNEKLSLLMVNNKRFDLVGVVDSDDWDKLITPKTIFSWNQFLLENVTKINNTNVRVFVFMLETNYGSFFAKHLIDKIISDDYIVLTDVCIFKSLLKKIDDLSYKNKLFSYIFNHIDKFSQTDAYNLYDVLDQNGNQLIFKIMDKLESMHRGSEALNGFYHAYFDNQF
jgi:hypothetical protein